MNNRQLYLLIISLLLWVSDSSIARAEVVTDGSMGPAGSAPGSPNFIIAEGLGTRAGNNLFHSFQSFNISSSESATFTGSSSIQNVISRVTGGSASEINGFLTSTVGNADFFFINPAGVLFGSSSWINVPASFYVSTADSLIFKDGLEFSASATSASSLSVAEPEAFGFTGLTNGQIRATNAFLFLQPDSTLSLVGGDIIIETGLAAVEDGTIHLFANGNKAGVVPIDSLGSSEPEYTGNGLLSLSESEIDGQGSTDMFLAGGTIILKDSSIYHLASVDSESGSIRLQADTLTLEDASRISSITDTAAPSANIDILVENQALLTGKSFISSESSNGGDGGDITIAAGQSLELADGAQVFSQNLQAGNGGTISVDVGQELNLSGEAQIFSSTSPGEDPSSAEVEPVLTGGNGGDIDIVAGEGINLFGGASIFSDNSQAGYGGNIDISTDGGINLSENSSISSSTSGAGPGGSVSVEVFQDINIADGSFIFSNTSGAGPGGSVSVETFRDIYLSAGSLIFSNTDLTGDAGSIRVEADSLGLDGETAVSGIVSEALSGSSGKAGEVIVDVNNKIQILNGAFISSNTFAEGDAGSVSVSAADLFIDGSKSSTVTGISSEAGTGSNGNAGEVDITVSGPLELLQGGVISSSTWGTGDAGLVSIRAEEATIEGKGRVTGVTTQSNRGAGGAGGSIFMEIAGDLVIRSEGSVSSSTQGSGNAGSVEIVAGDILIDGSNSTIFTGIESRAEQGASGSVGNIDVRAVKGTESDGSISLMNGGRISIAHYGSSGSGRRGGQARILLNADGQLSLTGGSRITSESTGNVPAANIDISSYDVLGVTGLSRISSESNNADAGDIAVQSAPYTILKNGLITTSVGGTEGDGGDISISTPILIMDNGFIQANTQGMEGRGGAISIDTDYLIGSYGTVEIGGGLPREFEAGAHTNIIQAAAPSGIPGDIRISVPVTDITGSLLPLNSDFSNLADVEAIPCKVEPGTTPSSLVWAGRGSLPPQASAPLSIFLGDRCDERDD